MVITGLDSVNNYGLILKRHYIYHGGVKLKYFSHEVEYTTSKPVEQPLQIDFAQELTWVVKYLQKTRGRVFILDIREE